MRILQSSVFRALCAIIIGALLIKFPDNTVKGITVAIGVLFLLSGLISCITYFMAKRNKSEYKIYDADGNLIAGEQPAFPIVGIGSAILGLILSLSPTAFVSALMYIIGAILILGAINQYMNLLTGRRYGHVSLWFWVMPTLILLTGLYVMLKPMAPLEMAMLILGWCTLLYGVVELINALKFYRDKKAWLQSQEQQPQLDSYEEVTPQ
ncbi:MAG: DUF308 domain-containing protein [Prevotella sp.]|nr:DUF308 domain-containing protein [Prevotella sp.]